MAPRSAVKSLGEIALRVNNLPQMSRFYQDVLGLFDRSVPVGPEHTTVDHLAFTISLVDYDLERRRLEGLGLKVTVKNHDWVRWRSLYFLDPEGNQLELVCYDPALGSNAAKPAI